MLFETGRTLEVVLFRWLCYPGNWRVIIMQQLKFGIPLNAWDRPEYGVDVAVAADSPMRKEHRSEYEDITATVDDDYVPYQSLPFVTDEAIKSIERTGFIVTLPEHTFRAEMSDGRVVYYSSDKGMAPSAFKNAAELFGPVAGQLLNIHLREAKMSDVKGTFDERVFEHLARFLTEREAVRFHLPSSRFQVILDDFATKLCTRPETIQPGMLNILKKNGWLQG
jgi:hypothetical protein